MENTQVVNTWGASKQPYISTWCLRRKWFSKFKGHEVACVGSVSVWFQSKDSLRSMEVLVGRAK